MSDKEFLYQQWQNLFKSFNGDEPFCKGEYKKIEQAYSKSNRHYHTLKHIKFMLIKAIELGYSPLEHPALFWSIWLHDVIYNTFTKDGEEKSAEYAARLLEKINANNELIERVSVYIKASAHRNQGTDDGELNLFLDLDLMILGQSRAVYMEYTRKIRKEYALIPLPIYKSGRKKMLKAFLAAEKIYQSPAFRKYEGQARENIIYELQQLS